MATTNDWTQPGPTVETFYLEVQNGALLIENGEGVRTESKVETLCADLRSSRQRLRHPYPGDLPMGVAFRSYSSMPDASTIAPVMHALKTCGIERFAINVNPENQSK